MNTISHRDSQIIWHPYTPMKAAPTAIGITHGSGTTLTAEDGSEYIDAISSWWVTLHGHSHPYIAQKVAKQMHTLEHSIFAGFTHTAAVELAERLLGILPPGMARIFYSDNGSTAVEVAIKMALQYWGNKGINRKKIVAIDGAYHGDTFGAMAVSGRSVFTAAFSHLLFDVIFIPFPEAGKEAESIAALTTALETGEIAAFIAEPLVQGSAGMRMYGPQVLEQYFALCKQHGALIIADEVMTGFGRTGPLFASSQIATMPDIVCLSKGLTGGVMPLGVTATTAQVFEAFYHDDRAKMLYHGHSFTANATACAAALASLDILLTEECANARTRIANAHSAFAHTLSGNPHIADIRQTGTIIAIELKSQGYAYHSNLRDRIYNFFIGKKILLRPLGNIIYILPPYCITDAELQYVYNAIHEFLATF